MKILAALVLACACAACGGSSPDPGDDVPGDDTPGDDTPDQPTALARCADPDQPIAQAWEVDNIRAPLRAQTQLGSTVLVSSDDGAVKTWDLPAAGGEPTAPHYGTPFVDEGTVVPVLAAGGGAFVGVDANGAAHLWDATGATLGAPIAAMSEAPTFVAIDRGAKFVATGSELGTPLAIADVDAGTSSGPLETQMWNVASAAFTRDGTLVTVGHWYGMAAIELRDPADPATVLAYWDGGHSPDGVQYPGWLRAVAVSADGASAIAVGDSQLLRFDLANVAAGPVAAAPLELGANHIVWSDVDDVALTLGAAGETDAMLTVWSTATNQPVRSTTVPAAVGLTADAAAGVLIMARTDGKVRGDRCGM